MDMKAFLRHSLMKCNTLTFFSSLNTVSLKECIYHPWLICSAASKLKVDYFIFFSVFGYVSPVFNIIVPKSALFCSKFSLDFNSKPALGYSIAFF